jgi:S-DNA-T family DNA segregation ATPase FtsK/SpoIIIE
MSAPQNKKIKKTSPKNKTSKNQGNENPMTNIIITLVLGFFLVISLIEIGTLGASINRLFSYLFGGPIFAKVVQIAIYVYIVIKLFKQKINTRKLVAIILALIAVDLAMTLLFINTSVKDAANINGQLNTAVNVNEFSGGGFLGIALYQILNPLIGNIGIVFLIIFLSIVSFVIYRNFSQEDQKVMVEKVQKGSEELKSKIAQRNQARKVRKMESNVELYDNPTASPAVKSDSLELIDFKETEAVQSEEESGFYTINGIDQDRKEEIDEPIFEKAIPSQNAAIKGNDNPFQDIDNQQTSFIAAASLKNTNEFTPSKSLEPVKTNSNKKYQIPTAALLDKVNVSVDKAQLKKHVESQKILVEQTLQNFGILGKVVNINVGPVVTQYEITLSVGVKVSSLLTIQNDLALALAAKDIRIQAPIPGKNVVGIEVPNQTQQLVPFGNLAKSLLNSSNHINVPIGLDINNEIINIDIAKMPHLLVAGSTGSGKSVFINLIITSILMQATPDEIKLIMIDPKKVELAMYEDIPHLLMPVVTEAPYAAKTLNYVVKLMEERYDVFKESRVRNIENYNQQSSEKMPYLVVIIDELADLMMVAKKEVESSIIRITQMARAAGIHLIVATQRPSTDVITGIIKANIPSRIAFAVSSQIDSRTILDTGGAEKLIGRGDMLYQPLSANFAERIQCGFISDDEVNRIVEFITNQQTADFSQLSNIIQDNSNSDNSFSSQDNTDSLFEEVKNFVITSQKASASLVQRRFNIGFNRAANIIDELEMQGIVGAQNGSKPREVLVNRNEGSE